MQKMSSVDTPLQTLSKQVEKTKELSTPYLVLSGTVLPIYIIHLKIVNPVALKTSLLRFSPDLN